MGPNPMVMSRSTTAAKGISAIPETRHDGAAGIVAEASSGHRLALLKATDLRDATTAIALVRRNHVVVLNCGGMEERQSQRLIDMVHGGVVAMDGQMRRISSDVVLACSALIALH